MAGRARGAAVWFAGAVAACTGSQSALAPAGAGAERIAALFWGMAIGALIVWVGMMALAVVAATRRREAGPRAAGWLIVGGGVVLPFVVLTGLLIAGLSLLPGLLAPAEAGPTIAVTGRQYWWRVRYTLADGATVESANELRLPLGRPTTLALASDDVVHALWIPALGGKVDMIPGRVNRLTLTPTRAGTYRGVCAEYCGDSHAWMALTVVVEEEEAFARWLAREAEPAVHSAEDEGSRLFLRHGCGACHAIRGTAADGAFGPDLTHVGARGRVGAGLLTNDVAGFRRWIAGAEVIKPGAHMPAFGVVPEAELEALATYLEGLR